MISNSKSLEAAIFNARFIKRAIGVLVAWLALLVIAYTLFVIIFPQSPQFIRFQVDVDNEGNWTTWVNSTLDLFAGLAALGVAWLVNRQSQ